MPGCSVHNVSRCRVII